MKKTFTILLLLVTANNIFAWSISSSLGINVCYGQTTTLSLLQSTGAVFVSSSVTWYSSAPTTANQCTGAVEIGAGTYFNVTVTGPITIWAKPACGVSNTSLVSITLNPVSNPPTPVISGNNYFCQSGNVALTSSVGNSYLWSNGLTSQSITVTQTGNYSVQTTNSFGCKATSLVKNITVSPLPNISAIASSSAVCFGNSLTLSGSGATTYTWTNGVNNGVAFTPSSTATYTVTGIDGNGCKNTAMKTITVNPLPNVTANTTNSIVCPSMSTILNGSGATTYIWTNGVSNGVAFTPSSTATYTVTGTNVNGCSNTAVKTITVSIPITPTIISSNGQNNLCSGVDYLTSSSVSNYVWLYNGSTITGATNANYIPTQSGFYQTSGSDINGCNSSSSVISINVNQSPNASITPNGATAFCTGDSVILTTGSANSYIWSNAASTQSIVVYTGGNYSVTLTNANGCSGTSSLTSITVYSTPTTPTIIQNANVLMSSASINNQWYLNGSPISGATSQFYTVTQSGLYSVSVTNSYSCSSMSASVNVVTTGITQFDVAKSITIYPNPSNGIFTIEFSDNISNKNYKASFTNMLGQVVFSSPINEQITNFDLSGLMYKGIYFVNIIDAIGNTIDVKKIVLQ